MRLPEDTLKYVETLQILCLRIASMHLVSILATQAQTLD